MHMLPKLLALTLVATASLAVAAEPKKAEPQAPEQRFVGSSACKRCHPEQSESFARSAKKARSWTSIERMKKRLTPKELEGCYACHTTGYGRPGGFESLENTPELANAGCETCHGPASAHVASGEKAQITRKPEQKDCEVCHSARIQVFNYRPVLRAGAH